MVQTIQGYKCASREAETRKESQIKTLGESVYIQASHITLKSFLSLSLLMLTEANLMQPDNSVKILQAKKKMFGSY